MELYLVLAAHIAGCWCCNYTVEDERTGRTYCVLTDPPAPGLDAAVEHCLSHGLFLLSLEDQQEADFISTQTFWSNIQSNGYWLRAKGLDMIWLQWLDCRPLSWTNWDTFPSETDNVSGNEFQCAYASTDAGHRWRSASCTNSTPDVVICEKEQHNCLLHANDRVRAHEYCYLTQPLTFSDAIATCQVLGYNGLAQIETEDERLMIFDLYRVKAMVCFSYGWYWLGLTRSDDTWAWIDGAAVGWDNWHSSPPGGASACAAASSSDDTWQSRPCAERNVVLCEKFQVNQTVSSAATSPVTQSLSSTVTYPSRRTSAVTEPETTTQSHGQLETSTLSSVHPPSTQHTTSHSAMPTQHTSESVTVQPTEPVSCPVPPSLGNATVSVAGLLPGSSATFTCVTGHTFPDGRRQVVTTCSQAGRWSVPPDQAGCSALRCPLIPEVPHRMISSQQTTFGSKVLLVCDVGHHFRSSLTVSRVTCTANGSWTPTPEPCIALSCPRVPTWYGLVFKTTARWYRTTINATCHEGAPGVRPSERASFLVTCGKDGKWSPPFTPCQGSVSVSMAVHPHEAKGSIAMGTVAVVLMASLFVGVLFVDIRVARHKWLIRKRKKRLRNVSQKSRTPGSAATSTSSSGSANTPVTSICILDETSNCYRVWDESNSEDSIFQPNVPVHRENTTGSLVTLL